MASGATLNSRLRVLITKTFRAEQLYASMRHFHGSKPNNLSELANDARAAVWQRAHSQLRSALNEAMALNSSTAIAARIASMQQLFDAQANEASEAVEKGTEELIETSKRHEFAHCFKLSLELVQHKARTQANRVVASELADILRSSGRGGEYGKELLGDELHVSLEDDTVGIERKRAVNDQLSNVIPFRRRSSSRVSPNTR